MLSWGLDRGCCHMIPRWVAVQAEMTERSCRRGSRGPEALRASGGWIMVENSQACWVRRMETPLWTACDGFWYSRAHLSGYGAQHCGQRTLPCAISGMEQKKAWGSRPGFQDMGQSPTVRVTSEGRLA